MNLSLKHITRIPISNYGSLLDNKQSSLALNVFIMYNVLVEDLVKHLNSSTNNAEDLKNSLIIILQTKWLSSSDDRNIITNNLLNPIGSIVFVDELGYATVLSTSELLPEISRLNTLTSGFDNRINGIQGEIRGIQGEIRGIQGEIKSSIIGTSSDPSTTDTIWGVKNLAHEITIQIKNELVGDSNDGKDYLDNDEWAKTIWGAINYAESRIESLIGKETDPSSYDTIWGAKNYSKEYADTKDNELKNILIGSQGEVHTKNTIYGAKSYADKIKTELIGSQGEVYTNNTIYGAKSYADYISSGIQGKAQQYANNKDNELKGVLIGSQEDEYTKDTIWGAKNYGVQVGNQVTSKLIGESNDGKDYQETGEWAKTIWGAMNYADYVAEGIQSKAQDYADNKDTELKNILIGKQSNTSDSDTIWGAKNFGKEYADAKDDEVKNELVGSQEDTYLHDTIYGAKVYADTKDNKLKDDLIGDALDEIPEKTTLNALKNYIYKLEEYIHKLKEIHYPEPNSNNICIHYDYGSQIYDDDCITDTVLNIEHGYVVNLPAPQYQPSNSSDIFLGWRGPENMGHIYDIGEQYYINTQNASFNESSSDTSDNGWHITFHAVWQSDMTKTYCTITWDKNGGTTNANPSSISVEKNKVIPLPENPKCEYTITWSNNNGSGASGGSSKAIYTFDGWYTEETGGTILSENTTATDKKTYYAHWIAPTSITLPTTNPIRSGYTFKGWAKTNNATASNVDSTSIPTQNVTYYAVWEKIQPTPVDTYEVRLNIINGSIVEGDNPQMIESGNKATWKIKANQGFNLPIDITNGTISSNIVTSNVVTSNITITVNCEEIPTETYYLYVGTTKPTSLSQAQTVTLYPSEQIYTNNSGAKSKIYVLTNGNKNVKFYNPQFNTELSQIDVDTVSIPGYKIFETEGKTGNTGTIKIMIL